MKASKISLFLLIGVIHGEAFAWGQTGHRISGAIAEHYLSDESRAYIADLLSNESLAEASTYPDEMRSNPDLFWQKTASPWHYVTVPDGKTYSQTIAPERGDAVTALKSFRETLQDSNASVTEKRLALRFIVHIVGDLHQPLHAGNGRDRGGNDVKVTFFWEASNLHRVWDSGLIERRQLSYTEWTSWLNEKITPDDVTNWSNPDPLVWIAESAQIRDALYVRSKTSDSKASVASETETEELSWDYQYRHLPTVKLRLKQAGVRIAAFLNDAIGTSPTIK
jgi:hypothetical protein